MYFDYAQRNSLCMTGIRQSDFIENLVEPMVFSEVGQTCQGVLTVGELVSSPSIHSCTACGEALRGLQLLGHLITATLLSRFTALALSFPKEGHCTATVDCKIYLCDGLM